MPMTDRGVVAVQQESDGTTSVLVCAGVRANRPFGVFARYAHLPSALVQPEVPLRRVGRVAFTEGIVEVSRGEGGVVSIREVPDDLGV
jgi:hypothetical protein